MGAITRTERNDDACYDQNNFRTMTRSESHQLPQEIKELKEQQADLVQRSVDLQKKILTTDQQLLQSTILCSSLVQKRVTDLSEDERFFSLLAKIICKILYAVPILGYYLKSGDKT